MILEKIIAGPIINLTDARYFAARGVKGIFFDVRPGSDSYIPEYEAIAIKEWVEVERIGFSMNGVSREENILIARDLALDFIVSDDFAVCKVEGEGLPDFFWEGTYETLRLELAAGRDMNGFAGYLISGVEMKDVEELRANAIAGLCYIRAEGGLEEIAALMDAGLGIHLKGGMEEKVGMKSYDELDEILDYLEERA